MRTSIAGATFLLVGGGLAAVGATTETMQGSDTIYEVTQDVLTACALPANQALEADPFTAGSITYIGGGSGTGEGAMTAVPPTQTIAPMSRGLKSGPACNGPAGNGANALQINIGLDGIGMFGNATEIAHCGGSSVGLTYVNGVTFNVYAGGDTSTSPTGTYAINDWKDALSIIYAGIYSHGQGQDCNGDIRRSLVNQWGSLFKDSCSGSTCTSLKRAYRREDLSGTTDLFAGLVAGGGLPGLNGLPGVTSGSLRFCNTAVAPVAPATAWVPATGFGGDGDNSDNDPIRVTCDPNEDVCGPGTSPATSGSLGLVTVVAVAGNHTATENYPTVPCTIGKFALMKPAISGVTKCPNNGGGLLFGKCFMPYAADASGNFVTAACIALKTPVQGFAKNGMVDGRAYNLIAKDPNFVPGVSTGGLYLKDQNNHNITGAFYRLHNTHVIASGAPTCQKVDGTDQIGCLVGANPCAFGYAGRTADQQSGTTAMLVNNVKDDDTHVNNLLTGGTPLYPMARELYVNTIMAPAAWTAPDKALYECFATASIIGPIMTARNFLPVPAGNIKNPTLAGGPNCEDLNESNTGTGALSCAGAGSVNNNACAALPAGFIH